MAFPKRVDLLERMQIADGEIPDLTQVLKFGYNAEVGTTQETVWAQGGAYSYIPTATQLKVSSSDANDAAAGTGARTVRVYGLDANYVEIQEDVALNGQTEVSTANSYLRVYRAFVLTAGSGGTAAGTVYVGDGTVTAGVPATVYADLGVGNQTQLALYTIPANRKAYITNFLATSFGNANVYATVELCIRDFGGVFRSVDVFTISRGEVSIPHELLLPVAAKSDIEVKATASSGTIDVSAEFDIIMKKI